MDFRLRGSKSIRRSPSFTQTKISKKCPPFGLAVLADLCFRTIEEYFGTPRSPESTNPSSTANALRKDFRRAYLGRDRLRLAIPFRTGSPKKTSVAAICYELKIPVKLIATRFEDTLKRGLNTIAIKRTISIVSYCLSKLQRLR